MPNCHRCNICHKPVRSTVWAHVLLDCQKLHLVDNDPLWTAFTDLLRLGFQGLALYTCFPLLCKYHERILALAMGQASIENS